jgi:hypothetical protein
MLLVTGVSGWTALGVPMRCGPAIQIHDPQLRAEFARLDRQRTADSTEFCAMSRNLAAQPASSDRDARQAAQ